MVSHKMFDLLDRVAQYARDDSRPFGGIQLIISGDFFQLGEFCDRIGPSNASKKAPVPNVYCNECGKDENLEPINKKTMICLNEPCVEKLASKDKEPNRVDKRTLYAFQSSAWERCNFTFLELTRIFRQCDAAFSALLNRLRLGCLTVEDIELLNSRVGVTDDDGIVPTRIETHRRAVKEENERMFKEFSATVVTYVCEDGATRGDHYAWSQIKYLNKRVRAEEEVRLKKGTQVMLTANLSVEEGLVNGSRGVVVVNCAPQPCF
ncbi:hypothetical protein BC830DRAFT_683452 [Chytriomyces sp. MP71]|nr:hypothetical protein BC830DRAFT_683452 [Chytriomyces sp. MP71]